MTSGENPYQATESGQVATATPGARRQLLPVAIGLLVTSILHVTFGLFYFAYVFSVHGQPGSDPTDRHMSLVYCMYHGISMLYCLILISGAFR